MSKPARTKDPNGSDLSAVGHIAAMVDVEPLKEHPDNYREHDDMQLDHIEHSARVFGLYKNVVLGRGDVILAGHGVVRMCRRKGIKKVPAVRLDIDPMSPRALKLVSGDNEISKLAMVDDRKLTDMLKKIKDLDPSGLVGTGFDETMLAALAMVTRPQSELADFDAAAHWVGMPEFSLGKPTFALNILFKTVHDRDKFVAKAGLDPDKMRIMKEGKIWSTWWPEKGTNDLASVAMREVKPAKPKRKGRSVKPKPEPAAA